MTRRLHRSMGAGAAVFVVFMVLSGLAINHSTSLGLGSRNVSLPVLLDWYGLEAPRHIRSYPVGDSWLSFAGSQVYFNEDPVSSLTGAVGAVSNGPLIIAAGSDELLLIDQRGQLVERVPWGSAGEAPIESIGLLPNNSVTVKTARQIWIADAEILGWQQTGGLPVIPTWSLPGNAPESLQKSITLHYRGEGLSQERVLLDFHSGRIFGSIGVFIYDLLALAVGFLAISGLIFWFQGRRNGK